MINKRVVNAAEAVADIRDGSSIMIGGFGEAGSPIELIHALVDQGASDLTVISNNCGSGQVGTRCPDQRAPRLQDDLLVPQNGQFDGLP